MFDDTHRQAGLWAVDTVNPNARPVGTSYMEGSAADVILTQELKIPDGYLRDQAEQTARNSKWSLAIEPCHVPQLGGHSAGTSVAVRSYIGMSEPVVVIESKHLHAQGRSCMKRASAMGKGGMHLGSPYLYSMVGKGGIRAKCNLDLLDSMAFTISGLVGPWMIGGDWNCTPEELTATGWLQKVGGVIHAPSSPTYNGHVYDLFRSKGLHLGWRAEHPCHRRRRAEPPNPFLGNL